MSSCVYWCSIQYVILLHQYTQELMSSSKCMHAC